MRNNLYIMGMGRSGTTLLQNMLDAHDNIVVPPESFFVLHLKTKYADETNWNQSTIKNFIKDLYTDRPFRLFWRIPQENVKKSFEAFGKIKTFQDACNAVRMSYRESYSTKLFPSTIIGDKNPIYSNFALELARLSPEAKIIHMVRDPRGTINSQINTFKRNDALLLGKIWHRYNQNVLKIKSEFPDRYFLLKYEELILNPEETAKKICKFLCIDYTDSMLNYRSDLVKRFAEYGDSLVGKHKNLMQPINQDLINKWEGSLTSDQKIKIEYSTHKIAHQLGYKFELPKVNKSIRYKMPLSWFKSKVWLTVPHIFFKLPFPIRKGILNLRSRIADHKYES